MLWQFYAFVKKCPIRHDSSSILNSMPLNFNVTGASSIIFQHNVSCIHIGGLVCTVWAPVVMPDNLEKCNISVMQHG